MAEDTKTYTTIPAQPGWFIALYIDLDNPKLFLEPIIAWEIERHEFDMNLKNREGRITFRYRQAKRDAVPITADSYIDTEEVGDYAIKRPDGSFLFPHDCDHADEAAALAHFAKKLAKRVKETAS